MTVNVFAVPVFFIVFRETLETSIIVAVLLAFLKQTLDGDDGDVIVYKKLVRQVWVGTISGFLICLIVGGSLIGVFYGLGKDHWASTEYYWEASFALVAALIITIVGAALLRISKMQDKWRVKIAEAMKPKEKHGENQDGAFKRWCEKYTMFMLPFITILREGIEAIVFVAGVSFSSPAAAVPLPVLVGLLAGSVVGYMIYKGGSTAKLQYFLVASTCLLYLVAAGLFSRAVWFFEAQNWNKVTRNSVKGVNSDSSTERGAGPGSYNTENTVWHVNCCSPELNGGGGWGIFNSILGWQNTATYGSVIAYNGYWIVVILGFLMMRYHEVRGHWPLIKTKENGADTEVSSRNESGGSERGHFGAKDKVQVITVVNQGIED